MSYPLMRPARIEDLPHLIHFASRSGFGITSLPNNPETLEKKLLDSVRSFQEELIKPIHETYIFCLEYEGKVAGTSGIFSRIGNSESFFAYHLLREPLNCSYLNVHRDTQVLHFIQARKKPTEIGTLFLDPAQRKKDWGKLLSFSRFLFMAQFRARFAPTVIAELRGINHEGFSLFWEAVGRPFFDIDFPQADFLRTEHHACIKELFPKHPIYVDLLPKPTQAVIAQVHPDTEPAKKILMRQGFRLSHYVDLFDAGPHFFCPTDEIDVIKNSTLATTRITSETQHETQAFLCNTSLNFRATLAPITLSNNQAYLTPLIAEILNLHDGDPIRYLAHHPK